MGRLDGKVAFVTGAASGIGRASAMRMATEGASVMCVDIDGDGAAQTASAINQWASGAASLTVDVSVADQVEAGLTQTADDYGRLDIIFNNAGIGGMRDWETTVAVNLSGVFYGLRCGAPHARGGRRRCNRQYRIRCRTREPRRSRDRGTRRSVHRPPAAMSRPSTA